MDNSEQEAIQELLTMNQDELDKVDHDVVKWICQGKNCTRGTYVRDYGIAPKYFHPRKGIHWFDIRLHFWMCGHHNKLYKRLIKNYPVDLVQEKILNFYKPKTEPVVQKKSNKINE
jgi:hypothetical protein